MSWVAIVAIVRLPQTSSCNRVCRAAKHPGYHTPKTYRRCENGTSRFTKVSLPSYTWKSVFDWFTIRCFVRTGHVGPMTSSRDNPLQQVWTTLRGSASFYYQAYHERKTFVTVACAMLLRGGGFKKDVVICFSTIVDLLFSHKVIWKKQSKSFIS